MAEPKAVFVAEQIGYRKYGKVWSELTENATVPLLVSLGSKAATAEGVRTWEQFLEEDTIVSSSDLVSQYWGSVSSEDILCLQFTSGTTGPRKAASLSHR